MAYIREYPLGVLPQCSGKSSLRTPSHDQGQGPMIMQRLWMQARLINSKKGLNSGWHASSKEPLLKTCNSFCIWFLQNEMKSDDGRFTTYESFCRLWKVVAKNVESPSFNQRLTEASKSGRKRLHDRATETKRTDMIDCLRCKRRRRKERA